MASKRKYNVAVVGATGAVGGELLRALEERRFPVKGIRLLASRRSKGRKISFNGAQCRVETLGKRAFDGMDVALFSAGADRSREFALEAVRRGAVVVDNSSAFRMAEGVPLVIPEVNSQALKYHEGLIANPNCSTIIMLLALSPLHEAGRIRRIVVSTYQSVSGAGTRAVAQLYSETQAALRRLKVSRTQLHMQARLSRRELGSSMSLPNQIAFNVIPHIDKFLEDCSTKEELKMVQETRKILDAPNLPISATCVRVPVFVGHSEAVWIETERPLSAQGAQELLRRAPGVKLVDRPSAGSYPLPIDIAGKDAVLVGRVRRDDSVPNGLALWVCGDNLRKGAATNAVQIAELVIGK